MYVQCNETERELFENKLSASHIYAMFSEDVNLFIKV